MDVATPQRCLSDARFRSLACWLPRTPHPPPQVSAERDSVSANQQGNIRSLNLTSIRTTQRPACQVPSILPCGVNHTFAENNHTTTPDFDTTTVDCAHISGTRHRNLSPRNHIQYFLFQTSSNTPGRSSPSRYLGGKYERGFSTAINRRRFKSLLEVWISRCDWESRCRRLVAKGMKTILILRGHAHVRASTALTSRAWFGEHTGTQAAGTLVLTGKIDTLFWNARVCGCEKSGEMCVLARRIPVSVGVSSWGCRDVTGKVSSEEESGIWRSRRTDSARRVKGPVE